MFRYYNSKAGRLRFAAPYTLVGVGGGVLALLGLLLFISSWIVLQVPENHFISHAAVQSLSGDLVLAGWFAIAGACLALLIAYIVCRLTPDREKIRRMVLVGLCCPCFGNPLHLQTGELLPHVTCTSVNSGRYTITITGASVSTEDIAKLATRISSLISGKYRTYAVLYTECYPDCSAVEFCVEDVTPDRSITYKNVEEMRNPDRSKLMIQHGTALDLQYSGSILIAGKTRSGKTTALICLMLQILLWGRDNYNSLITIIDPKVAELSRVSRHVITLDEDGGARKILAAMRRFAEAITERQAVLNALSEKWGNAVHWWEADMLPSFLVLDEFVSLRTLFPKKADKSDPGYSLEAFDELLKRIVTMGQSAGAFTVISIAQASVDEGGLPSMLRSAMGTKILFRPTLEEGRFLWPGSVLETLGLARKYIPGDAWLSSTDGEHDFPGFVHFPNMDFPVYRELGRLLDTYYGN